MSTNLFKGRRAATASLLALSAFSTFELADCGSINSNSNVPATIATPKPSQSSNPNSLGYLTVSVTVPNKGALPASALRHSASARHPEYVTSSVQSIMFTQTLSVEMLPALKDGDS
jgi:hypothetical protein